MAESSLNTDFARQRGHEVGAGTAAPREVRLSDTGPGTPTQETMSSEPPLRKKRPRLVRFLLGIALVLASAVIVNRLLAPHFDFAVANILTLILSFFAWLATVAALKFSQLPRALWRGLLVVPLLLVAGLFAFYRWDGVDAELVPKLTSRWKSSAKLPAKPGAPSQLDARFETRPSDSPQFFGPGRTGEVTGISLETDWTSHPPELLWKHPIGAGWSGFAVQGDAAVTLEQRAEEQWISAYHVESGELLWQASTPGFHTNPLGGTGPRSTPTIVNNRVIAQTATAQLICLDLGTGVPIWSHDLWTLAGVTQAEAEAEVSWGRAASPLVVDELVICPLGGAKDKVATLIAFGLADGQEVWRSGDDQISYSSPCIATIDGVRQVLYISQSYAAGYSIADGRLLWQFEWSSTSSGDASVSQPIPIDDNRIWLSKGYSRGASVVEVARAADGNWTAKKLWAKTSVLRTKFTSCVIKDGYAYGLSDGILECVEVSTGTSKWKKGRYRHGQVLLVGDILLISSEAGEVVLVAAKPEKFEELAKQDFIGDPTWNPPTLSGNRLLIRNAEEAACIRLPLVSTNPKTSESVPVLQ